MLKTGIHFIDGFSQFLVFLPLLPILIVLVRRVYHADLLILLMVLCLLQFIQSLVLQNISITSAGRYSVVNIFSLLEMLVYLQVFRIFFAKKARRWLDIFVIALLSAILTYYILRGTGSVNEPVNLLQNGFVVMLILAGLPRLVANFDLRIFQSALFWISTGTLFYMLIFLLVAWASPAARLPETNSSTAWDSALILNIASLVRYIFYCLAALLYTSQRPPHQDKD